MTEEKYALLDADYISKAYRIQNQNHNKLIDLIMELPGYHFYCHEQIRTELARDELGESLKWLESMIANNFIRCYSDEEILDELSVFYNNFSTKLYANMLRAACEAYQNKYYENHFPDLNLFDYSQSPNNEFLEILKMDCQTIGLNQNLGEIKSYVLLQMLNAKHGKQIYVFCSDDKDARNGIINIGEAQCISILSSFARLHKERNLSIEDAMPYMQSYLALCSQGGQTTFRVQDNSKERRMCKISGEQIFDDIFEGKVTELRNGNLKYIV